MGTANGGTVNFRIATDVKKTMDVVGERTISLDKSTSDRLDSGTGTNQCNKAYILKISGLAPAGAQSIDMSGSLEDVFGDPVVLTKLRAILIHNTSDAESVVSAANVTVTGNFITSRLGASTSIPLEAGDAFAMHAGKSGLTVTNTSADVITITNAHGSENAAVEIILLGN